MGLSLGAEVVDELTLGVMWSSGCVNELVLNE